MIGDYQGFVLCVFEARPIMIITIYSCTPMAETSRAALVVYAVFHNHSAVAHAVSNLPLLRMHLVFS